jgi:hypothetical protein
LTNIRIPRTNDVCVRVTSGMTTGQAGDSAIRTYDVCVHSYSWIGTGNAESASVAPSGNPTECSGLTLQVTGRLTLKWVRYQDILAQFFEGVKGLEAMYYRLRDALSRELLQWIDQLRASDNRICVWWSSDAPELEDIPWELLFYGNPSLPPLPQGFNFVRGVPPETPTPVLPLSGPVRVLWCNAPFTQQWLRDLFQPGLSPGIVPIPFTGSTRARLRLAAGEGIEMVHLCSDGTVSLAYEGVLIGSDDPEPLTAPELADIFRGSRVSVLALTSPFPAVERPSTDPSNSSDTVVTVFRAFAYLASSRVRLPSVIAPVGPTTKEIASLFWKTFYTNFGMAQRLDASFAAAKQAAPASTYALFQRHSHGKLFRDVEAASSIPSPARMAVDLESSLDLSKRLQALTAKYGSLPDYVSSFAQEETQRRQTIEWTATEAEE